MGATHRLPSYPVGLMLSRIARAVEPYPRAMLFELRARGYGDVYSQLVACLLSVRTFDEVSLVMALRLLAVAPSLAALRSLPRACLLSLVSPCTYAGQKAGLLAAIAERGALPSSYEELLELPGIGPKCAALAAGIALGEAQIGVDVHVHRVTNRWGYVSSFSPAGTEEQLRARLPRRYWVRINELLVPFGKHICTRLRPRCSECPVLSWCEQVGVRNPR